MTKRMLIDAAHAEETRVVVVDGNRIEELDFESQSRKQLRGNIYLAKVTRVEPSLQAAFIEYGGNRHGFLAFNEIHPDYYQIPVADREALLREEAEEEAQMGASDLTDSDDEDEMDEVVERRRRRLMRRYKIQEVVKRRQIMLVQVVKEERGNKGAALTTYLSLAGRYCVLMPNTARGGGISRKITSATDRKRLKSAVHSLDVPAGMGLIIRTAGAARTKLEIKRDYEYLMRLWENIREKTLQSIAPALIYEEEDLVKRAIRDMFDKDLDSIQVEGEAGYREARDFMRMIMPSQAKKVIHYREPTPLFVRHRVEDQISQIHSPVVQLKSGGYLVINQTEALVAIDVNSGRSTRERNIETTAFKTNVEAAEEAARQLRLRDLAGLIVIDFIDMEEAKNNRAVEKVLKDALKDDRARLQMGKISSFGLMEISRQRRRTGVLEGSTHVCEHCQGTGRVRSVESSAVAALRSIEMESVKGGAGDIIVRLPTAVGLYLLNEKRAYLAGLDESHDLHVTIVIDDKLAQADIEIERTETREGPPRERIVEAAEPEADWTPPDDDVEEDEEIDPVDDEVLEPAAEALGETAEDRERKRRRRRRGGRREEIAEAAQAEETADDEDEEEDSEDAEGGLEVLDEARPAGDEEGGPRRRRRRRGRRGGRRLREDVRTQDVYAWSSPHPEPTEDGAPIGDPYVWLDPHAPRLDGAQTPARAAPAEAAARRPVEAAPAGPAHAFDRKRGRGRRRGRGGGFGGGDAYGVRSGEGADREPQGPDPYAWTTPAEADAADEEGAAPASGGAEVPREAFAALGPDPAAGMQVPDAPAQARVAETPAFDPAVAAPLDPEGSRAEAGAPGGAANGAFDAPPAPPPPARKPRRSRAKAAPAAAEAETAAPVAESAEPLTAPPAATVTQPATAPLAHADPSPDQTPAEAASSLERPSPVLETAAADLAAPDPAEISAPPATPRRGWWRRLV